MQQAGPVPLRKQIEMYGLYYRIDSIQGRYQSALRNYALTKMISDSVFNIEKWGQIEELQLKYETARKDRELQQRAHDIAWLTEQGILREALFEQKNSVHGNGKC
ncbi:hypothetical protein MKQ70_04430 [Chitinophaga sedimenti]|uniref:hypothetical protein n=1 Tax=Chitinophaga sedimenti TaxID=2033606 RepID=UPI0020067F32|nr:hypothetical protein [Chitinophaga sedimenti]MCK7554297.1 hypothetical protein [Chitinophaga sedimenti]